MTFPSVSWVFFATFWSMDVKIFLLYWKSLRKTAKPERNAKVLSNDSRPSLLYNEECNRDHNAIRPHLHYFGATLVFSFLHVQKHGLEYQR